MGDELEGKVAVVALIVSLIALIVTLNQFILQLASTADGYRRCAESVIDSWHIKRKRKWKWSEFRFETQYVTPQIVLITPQELDDYEYEVGEVYLINSPGMNKDEKQKVIDDTVHSVHIFGAGRPSDQYRIRSRIASGLPRGRKAVMDVEKAEVALKRTRRSTRVRTESDPIVSWLRLLKELHNLSYSYWPEDCTTPHSAKLDKIDTGIRRTDYNALKKLDQDDPGYQFNLARTDVAIIYRTWTWDFMPPDMVRPLAETNIGDIMVLALRMGMQWKALDPDSGRLQADGNGYNLSSTDVKGLGIVLRFTSAGTHDWYPRIIPSQAADKLLLGIVPGDPYLVGRDYAMIDNNGDVQAIARHDGLLRKIGVPDPRREYILKHTHPAVKNDVIHLLLPFLPLDGSTIASYCSPIWWCVPGILGVHCFWEGRIALHRKLRERVQGEKISSFLRETLQEVLNAFDVLEQRHSDDWYSRFAAKSKIRNGSSWEEKLECINDCRRIHRWTGDYLRQHGWSDESNSGHTKYVHLVAAHAVMAYHAIEEAERFARDYPHDKAQPVLKKAYDITEHHGYYFVLNVYEYGIHYAKHLHHPGHGVSNYLRSKGLGIDDDEVEAAWWVAQLRGITLNLCTHHPDNVVSSILGPRLVPSSFYGNKSPVWIT